MANKRQQITRLPGRNRHVYTLVKPTPPKGFLQRITEFFSTAETTIRRHVRIFTRRWIGAYSEPVDDWGRSDYDFWRNAYRANVKGLEYSGLFIKPVVEKIASWTLTPPPEFEAENEAGQTELNKWFAAHRADVLKWLIAAMKVGDSLLVVNADLSVTIVPADYVDPIVADDDYSKRIGWQITQTFAHPQETRRMIMTDQYYADRRVHRIEIDGLLTEETVYPNLIGVIPCVLLANNADDGQTFGYAEAAAALNMLYRYNDVLLAGVEGNIQQGRPTPVAKFDTEQDLDKFWSLYGEDESVTNPDGTIDTETVLKVDVTQVLTLSAGSFEYAQPGSFAGDTEKVLGLIFYLLLEHWQVPEFVFGNAISSSHASAQAQMPIWENTIKARQTAITQSLIELGTVVSAYLSILVPGVVAEVPTVNFKPLTQDGKLILEAIKWLYLEGLIDRRTALMLAPITVDNIDQVLDQADQERAEREEAALERMEGMPARGDEEARDREIERMESENESEEV